MSQSRAEDNSSIAPRRSLAGNPGDSSRPVLPPPPPDLAKGPETTAKLRKEKAPRVPKAKKQPAPRSTPQPADQQAPPLRGRSRKARLRLVQIDAWSVMKTAFLLSIAIGIVTVVAVLIVWSVLGAAGVWDSINSMVQQALGTTSGTPFEIQKYVGTSRIMGLTMMLAVLDVILITAIATLSAFLYNLAATLLGGIEVTFAEDH
jgi:hypothetical protein